jgi:hypothetical protein
MCKVCLRILTQSIAGKFGSAFVMRMERSERARDRKTKWMFVISSPLPKIWIPFVTDTVCMKTLKVKKN